MLQSCATFSLSSKFYFFLSEKIFHSLPNIILFFLKKYFPFLIIFHFIIQLVSLTCTGERLNLHLTRMWNHSKILIWWIFWSKAFQNRNMVNILLKSIPKFEYGEYFNQKHSKMGIKWKFRLRNFLRIRSGVWYYLQSLCWRY